jgi:hypothetical protein
MSNNIATVPFAISSAGPLRWVWSWCQFLPNQLQFLSSVWLWREAISFCRLGIAFLSLS